MLTFKDVTFRYPEDEEPMVENLSFDVKRGEFISLIGASGCGKSTIFRLINRLLKPEKGEIFVDGKEIGTIKSYAGYMPQKDLLFPWRTVEKNLCLPMEIQKISKEEQKRRVSEVLKEVGLEEYREKYPKDLSGGMRQRISFARTLLTDADLMLLDEPFSALDALTRMDMQEWLLEQWEHFHKTIVFITHDVEEAVFLSKKIYVITDTPIKELRVEVVPQDYPRDRDFLRCPDIELLKAKLTSLLRKQVE
ncbi:MAG: ABC transporter ATP-binding protein [Clostridia bacterium]|nr:ABC transporter ATP-binding protein [Clostridia bacterium]NCD01812.1 ABC transporter ATP-binding protein [Clostridia bacterium]